MWKTIFTYKNYVFKYNIHTKTLVLTSIDHPNINNIVVDNIDPSLININFLLNCIYKLKSDSIEAFKQYEEYSREFKKPNKDKPRTKGIL